MDVDRIWNSIARYFLLSIKALIKSVFYWKKIKVSKYMKIENFSKVHGLNIKAGQPFQIQYLNNTRVHDKCFLSESGGGRYTFLSQKNIKKILKILL